MNRELVADLNVALDEAVVRGVGWDPRAAQAWILVQVMTLPSHGPAEPDPRRKLVLSQASSLRIVLRRNRSGAVDFGPPIPVADQAALEAFLASLAFADGMYGGRALDDASPADDWPASSSLEIVFTPRPAPHCLYWFTDGAREEPGGTIGYRLEGLVRFSTLTICCPDGTPVPSRDFADAGMRWWTACRTGDPRASALARRTLVAEPWSGAQEVGVGGG